MRTARAMVIPIVIPPSIKGIKTKDATSATSRSVLPRRLFRRSFIAASQSGRDATGRGLHDVGGPNRDDAGSRRMQQRGERRDRVALDGDLEHRASDIG